MGAPPRVSGQSSSEKNGERVHHQTTNGGMARGDPSGHDRASPCQRHQLSSNQRLPEREGARGQDRGKGLRTPTPNTNEVTRERNTTCAA